MSSPEISSLVETMLSTSDNDLAESLIRLVAIGRDHPATFEGGTAAVAEVLAELGVPTDGLALLDGSGLSRGSRIAPETLGALLALAASDGATPGFDRWSPACRSLASPALSWSDSAPPRPAVQGQGSCARRPGPSPA